MYVINGNSEPIPEPAPVWTPRTNWDRKVKDGTIKIHIFKESGKKSALSSAGRMNCRAT